MAGTVCVMISLLTILTISGSHESVEDIRVDEVDPVSSEDIDPGADHERQDDEFQHVEEDQRDQRGHGSDISSDDVVPQDVDGSEGVVPQDVTTTDGVVPLATTTEGVVPLATTTEGVVPLATTTESVVPLATTTDHTEPSSTPPSTSDESPTHTEGGAGEGGRESGGEGEGWSESGEDVDSDIAVTETPNTFLDPPTEPPPATPITTPEAPPLSTDELTPSDTPEAIHDTGYETTPTEAIPSVEGETGESEEGDKGEGEEEEEGGDDVPTFTEFSQRKRMEQDSTQKPTPEKPVGGKNNYASLDCGAKIIASNPEAQNAAAILSENRDVYMINPCSADIWVIVELCELVELHSLQIACFELFSSIPKSFNVSVSERYPSDEWRFLGTMIASNEREIQSFPLAADESSYAKFVRVAMVTHYGNEHYCPLSLLRVIGASMMEVYEYSESQQEFQTEPSSPTVAPSLEETVDEELFAGVSEDTMSHGITGSEGAASLPGMVAGVIKSFWETVSDYISLSPEESLTSHPLGDTHPNREEEASVSERSESVADLHQISCEGGVCDGARGETGDGDMDDDSSVDRDSEQTRDSDVMHGTETNNVNGTVTVDLKLSQTHSTTSDTTDTVQSPVHSDDNAHSTTSIPSPDSAVTTSTSITHLPPSPSPSPSSSPPSSPPTDRDDESVLEMVSELPDQQLTTDDGLVADSTAVVDPVVDNGSPVDDGGIVLVDVDSIVSSISSTVVSVGTTVVNAGAKVVSSATTVVSVGTTVVDDPEIEDDTAHEEFDENSAEEGELVETMDSSDGTDGGSGEEESGDDGEGESSDGESNDGGERESSDDDEGERGKDGEESLDDGLPVAHTTNSATESGELERAAATEVVDEEGGGVGDHNTLHNDHSGPESTKDDQTHDKVEIQVQQDLVIPPPPDDDDDGDSSEVGVSGRGEKGGNGDVSEGVGSESGEEVTMEGNSGEGNTVIGGEATNTSEGERSHDTLNEGLTNGNGAGMLSGQQKEKSVFLRLSNRIRDLEVNMSLFSSYLDQVSSGMKRNKNRTEDNQRAMEKRLNSLNDSVQDLTNQTELVLAVLAELVGEIDEMRKTVDTARGELQQSMRELLQYCVVIATLLVAMVMALPLWLLCNRTANTMSHDSHVTQSLNNKRVEYSTSDGGGHHVTGNGSHVTSKELPACNGIQKAHHIISGNSRTLPEATQSLQREESISDTSLHSGPWSRVVRKKKKKPKTL